MQGGSPANRGSRAFGPILKFTNEYERMYNEKKWILKDVKIYSDKKKISGNDILDLAINSGAEDCTSENLFHEIITTKENFNKVRLNIEKKIEDFISSGIEWIPINKVSLDEEKTKSVLNFLTMLEDDDDVQHVYANLEVDSPKLEKALTA